MNSKQLWCGLSAVMLSSLVIGAASARVSATAPAPVTPFFGGTVGGSTIPVDNTAGDQLDPHVSGDMAAYTDAADPAQAIIRYYDFLSPSSPNPAIPSGPDFIDTLSNVDGNNIAFARFSTTTGVRSAMVFNVAAATTVQIGTATQVGATALGGDTIAFVNGSPGEIFVGRISDPDALLVPLSASGNNDLGPVVSPGGNIVTWSSCAGFSCSIMKSQRFGGAWSSPTVVRAAPASNADTDGVDIVFDSAGDIFFQAAGGGADTQLELSGIERNPSIAGGVIAFESAVSSGLPADVFVYQISTNTIYRVTDTPLVDETLNDITVLPSGDLRVVWAADDDASVAFARNVYARTFALPVVPPDPDPDPIDHTPPTLTIATPGDGATFTKGQFAAASYSCQDEAAGSGLASCAGPVASGAALDTTTVGSHSFAVTATDHAGNSATATHTYSVVYQFVGFFQPVDNVPTLNLASAGSSIPVKFSLGGNQGLAIFAPGYPASSPMACDSNDPGAAIEETLTAGASSLSYSAAADQYTYVWKTDKAWKGTCRMLVVVLNDGSHRFAKFKFK